MARTRLIAALIWFLGLAQGVVYHYDGRAADVFQPASSWYTFWLQVPTEHILLYLPPQHTPTRGRNSHGRALNRRPQHKGSPHFGYSRHNGPDMWPLDFPTCSGSRQSPINLDSDYMYRLVVPEPLLWEGYWNRPHNQTLANNGHTVQISGNWGGQEYAPYISGGPLEGEYVFSQLHFHWGTYDTIGSEHTVSNISFPMEMHLVHYKKSYGSQNEAIKHEDGLAVVAFLFQLKDRQNPSLNTIMPFLDAVVGAELEVRLSRPFPLEMLDLMFTSDYVTYLGSLTTPPCSEVVTWIVSSRPLYISHDQLAKFRHLSSAHSEMENNFRPVQPTNGRPVFYVS